MNTVIPYSLLSVALISLISLIGVFFIPIKRKKILIYLISLSAGTLIGDAFLHLLPESVESTEILTISYFIIGGIVLFFFLEKILHWRHCHSELKDEKHVHSFAYMNLVGDGMHNLIDGVIIASSYLVSTPVGIATTIAVALHEIPQEIGDFGVLIHGGFSKSKALLLNFVSGVFAILGAILTLWINAFNQSIELYLIPVAIGGFIYIAGSDLIPETHKHSEKLSDALVQTIAFILGIAIMFGLLFLE